MLHIQSAFTSRRNDRLSNKRFRGRKRSFRFRKFTTKILQAQKELSVVLYIFYTRTIACNGLFLTIPEIRGYQAENSRKPMLKSQLSPLMIKHFRRSRSPNIIFLAFFGVCLHSFVAPVFSTLVRWAISTGTCKLQKQQFWYFCIGLLVVSCILYLCRILMTIRSTANCICDVP